MSLAKHSIPVTISDSDTVIITVGEGETVTVVSLLTGNVDGAADATMKLTLTKDGESAVDMFTDLSVAVGEPIEILTNGRGNLFLEEGDVLSATASAADDIVVTASYLVES